MSYVMVPDERVYAQVTHPWDGEIPNSGSPPAATVGDTDAIKHVSCKIEPVNALIRSRAKTGSRSQLVGFAGRRGATFSLEVPLIGSGTKGTAPDIDPLIEAIFGAAGDDTPATSVAYAFADAVAGLAIFSFRDPADDNMYDRILAGGVVNNFTIAPNQDNTAALTVEGSGVYLVNHPNFANLDTAGKCGLGSFPDEPSTPSYTGSEIPGFVGSATLSTGTYKISDWKITGALNRAMRASYGSWYPDVTSQGVREITLDLDLFEENSAAMATLRHLVYSKDTFDVSLVIGEDAGNIWTFTCSNLQPPAEESDESQNEYVLRLAGCVMTATSAAAKDEFALTIT